MMKSAFPSVAPKAFIVLLILGIVASGPVGAQSQFNRPVPPSWAGGPTVNVQPGQPVTGGGYDQGGIPTGAEYVAQGVTRTVPAAGMPGSVPGADMGTGAADTGLEMGYAAGDRLRLADEIATRTFGEELPKEELAQADTEIGVARVMGRNPDLVEADVPDVRTIEEYNEAAKLKLAFIKIEGKMYRYTGGLSQYELLNNPIRIGNQYRYRDIAPMVSQAVISDNMKEWPNYYMMQAWQSQQYSNVRGGNRYGQQARGRAAAVATPREESVVGSMGVGLDLYQQAGGPPPANAGRAGRGATGRYPGGTGRYPAATGRYPTAQQGGRYPGGGGLPTGRY